MNDTLYYVVKRVKGTIEGDICEVTDDEIIAYNFRGKLDKGIKVTSTFRRNQNDSSWYLAGTWKTNSTKKYYSVTGKVSLEEEKDLTASKIFPHLEELNLAENIAFYKDRKEGAPIVKLVKPEKIKTEYAAPKTLIPGTEMAVATGKPAPQRAEASPVPAIAIASADETKEEIAVVEKPSAELPKTDTKIVPAVSVDLAPALSNKIIAENKVPAEVEIAAVKKPARELPKTDTKTVPAVSVNVTPVLSNKTIAKNKVQPAKVTEVVVTTEEKNEPAKQNETLVTGKKPARVEPITKPSTNQTTTAIKTTPEIKKQETASKNPEKGNVIAANNTVAEKKATAPAVVSVIPEPKKPEIDITLKSALIAGRKSEFSQVVSFKADSLELSLYDNGEIDGDTVSIYMDGEVILSKQGLKGSAIKKTIYITPGHEDFTLVLFAENLGKYPPNTGLLVVHDGEDVYNLRFSSDFQKNAGIVFRRKK